MWAHLLYRGIQMLSSEYGFCWKLNATTVRINPPLPGFLSSALRKTTHTLPKHRKKSDQSDKGFIFLLQVRSIESCPMSVQLVKWNTSDCIPLFIPFFFLPNFFFLFNFLPTSSPRHTVCFYLFFPVVPNFDISCLFSICGILALVITTLISNYFKLVTFFFAISNISHLSTSYVATLLV